VIPCDQLLELDGRLSLIPDLLAHAEKRGEGVEQSAHARSLRGVDTARGHLHQDADLEGIPSSHQVERQVRGLRAEVGRHVRMVMLDGDLRHALAARREAGAVEVSGGPGRRM
jgi:hypothetical protein